MNTPSAEHSAQTARQRRANLRVAWILALIAVAFFFGVIVARYMGGLETGMGIVGLAALLLLIFAIVRSIRDR
jgi:hypothetical protein